MAAWSFPAKLTALLAALIALTFVDVLVTRTLGVTTTFLSGWIMCSLYRAMSRVPEAA